MADSLHALTPRRLVAGTAAVVLVGLGFWLLYRYVDVLLLFFAAIIISMAAQPLVARLHSRGLPRTLAVTTVYGGLLLLIVGFVALVIPLSYDQAAALLDQIPRRYVELREAMLANPNFFIFRMGFELPESLPGLGGPPAAGVPDLRFAALLARTLFAIVATLALAFYWSVDGQRTLAALTLLVPLDRRESARQFVAEVEGRLAAFVAGQATLCLIVGLLSLAVFLALGVPNALLLALLAGLFEALPLIGPAISMAPAALLAYAVAPSRALAVVLAMAVIQQLEYQFLVPRVMKRSLNIHPLVTLLAVMSFGLLFGVLGALVAVPLTAVIQLILERTLLAPRPGGGDSLPGRDRRAVLRYELQELTADLRGHIRQKKSAPTGANDAVEDTMETLAADLERYLVAGETGARRA